MIMAQDRRRRRHSDLDRIKRLFTADDAEFDWLRLIAWLDVKTRIYAAA